MCERSEWRTQVFSEVSNEDMMARSFAVAEGLMIWYAWGPCVANMTWSYTSVLPFSKCSLTSPSLSLLRCLTVVLRNRWFGGNPLITALTYDLAPFSSVSQSGLLANVVRRWWFHLDQISLHTLVTFIHPTYIKRTSVTAGNSKVHLSGLVLHTAAVKGIR